MSGPLAGVRVVELAGIGPAPFAGMLLADLGADVICVDRVVDVRPNSSRAPSDILSRGRRSIAVDLKQQAGRDLVLDLVRDADVFIEPFRPGVTERLGLAPEVCLAANPRLVYARMTGWGQDGPLAHTAGHDITYLALTGALDGARRAGQRPVPPMNLLGDLGGGALYLVVGVLSALFEASRSGQGQIVDAAIVDGVASMGNLILGLRAQGLWDGPPGGNLLDTGAACYDVYACADGREIAVGALEPQFYAELLARSGVEVVDELRPERRLDPSTWPAGHRRWTELFASRPRDEWLAIFADSDACVAPVLSWDEAAEHPHLQARQTYVARDGVMQAAPAPRFSRTPAAMGALARPGEHTDMVLTQLGRSAEQVAVLRAAGVIA